MNEQHINELHARLESVSAVHDSVGDSSDMQEMFRIIHAPGWTTPVELSLILALVEAAERAAQQAIVARQALVAGARAIAEASVSV